MSKSDKSAIKMLYFDKYADLIYSGKIPVCKEMLLALKRVERYKKEYIYKPEEVKKRIDFIQNECSHTKGKKGRLKLSLPQLAWLDTLYGFYNRFEIKKTNLETLEGYSEIEERRLINQMPIVVARGTGKTTFASAIAKVGLLIDGEIGADIQCLATTREQAGYLYNASRAMTNSEGTIPWALNQKIKGRNNSLLRSTKQGLYYEPTNSLMSIKTSDYEALDGTNAHYNIFDEVHSYKEDFIQVVNDGSATKRKNWLSLYITTNGTMRNAVFDRYYKQWVDVLNDKVKNDSIMPFIYKLDSVDEVKNKAKWVKAMPHLGITTDYEAIEKNIEMAKDDPVRQAELLAKMFNIPVNNYLAYFTNEECRGHKELFKPELFIGNEDRKARCVIGIDLSDVNDICSVSFMIVENDKRYFKNLNFIPRKTVDSLPREQKERYQDWEVKGLIHIHELDFNEQDYIFNQILAFINENKILPVAVGFDKWNARQIVNLFNDYYGDICIEVAQTVKNISPLLKVYKSKLNAGKVIFDDEVSSWMHSNVMVKTDANNNIFPNKKEAKNKIDVFMSQLDAFIAYENNIDDLQYYFE